ncbi:MAG: DUF1566 domain-containing protein [Deltaproteobacteria bacterium]|nr:DUF1566 domain-containing protein [Deltaproteobacteria bacterium]
MAAPKATPSPSDKCESGKNDAAGKYTACLAKAERRLILTSDLTRYTSDVTKCASKFDSRWEKLEAAAAAQAATCPSEDDGVEIQDFLDSCSQSVAGALAGGTLPDPAQCQADLATCEGDLATTEADLGTCTTDLGTCNDGLTTCNADLTTAQDDLAACNGSLDTCTADLGTCGADLGTCNADLGTCNTDLGTCNTDLGTCSADLATTQGNLDTCNTDLGTCNGDLGTCNGDLGTCNTDLGTCNTDLGTCNTDLGTCNSDLGTCNTDLGTCNADLTTCGTDLATAQGDLATCNGDLGTCNTDLGTCTTDLATCEAKPLSRPLSTVQTTCYDPAGGTGTVSCTGTGQDGEFHLGSARSYTDNGDGTITDDVTGLMWEKLSDDGSIHDQDATYTWPDAFTGKIAALNTAVFAGHADWRLPNRNELETLTSLASDHPATEAAFNTACAPSCTVTTCSCIRSNFYWTSTTYSSSPGNAWIVGFAVGNTNSNLKSSLYYVRAVRGGS